MPLLSEHTAVWSDNALGKINHSLPMLYFPGSRTLSFFALCVRNGSTKIFPYKHKLTPPEYN